MGVKGGWDLLNPTSSVSFVDWSSQKISTSAIVKKMPIWLTNDFKRLLEGFGFSYWDAPGEAEAELVMLSRLGRIDAVMSEDFDTMLFGAQQVIRIKEESDSKYLIEGVIMMMEFKDVASKLQLISQIDDYAAVASAWRRDLCTALEKQGAGHLHSRQRSLASRIPLDFPKVLVLIQYIHPVTSQSNGVGNLPAAPSLRQPDISQLAKLCEELFVWGHSMGIILQFP
ncbi:uncharacterized protein EV420DRAFT_1651993 [Desarmillaria tabescens]|uniref:XPG-I domain-containing protein n=1 Tax=Armillaria tabescens TaxID=1929756 RepID=A0AA39J8Q1_ARMTA|nr:uncharacterized protein EV420DRAFT_1651993 [Desarmillaria tabescens]KAK0437442.1 hypothetical protein EV420DRAFT_1651993 [Desarmillaria tabescens]